MAATFHGVNVFRSWEPEFDHDFIARLASSRCGVLRALGRARRSVLVNKLMTALSWKQEIFYWTGFFSMVISYFAFVAAALSKDLRHDMQLLSVLFSVFGVFWIIAFSFCYWHRKKIYQPDRHLELEKWQRVGRGNLVETTDGCQQAQLDTGSNVGFFNLCGSNVRLGDFELRHRAYQLRSVCHIVAVAISSLATGLRQLEVITVENLRAVLLVPHAIVGALTLEALMSCIFGQQLTLSFLLGKCMLALKRTKHKFEPFDPRAAVLQNMAFSIMLGTGSMTSVYIVHEEGLASSSPALWMLPTVVSLLVLVVTQIGVPYSFCPGSFAVGLAVESGWLAKPRQGRHERTCLLTYGIFGPVVEPSMEPVSEETSSCCLAFRCRRKAVAPAPEQP